MNKVQVWDKSFFFKLWKNIQDMKFTVLTIFKCMA